MFKTDTFKQWWGILCPIYLFMFCSQCIVISEWVKWVNKMSVQWKNMNQFWLHKYNGPLHVVKYQNLKTDVKAEMQKICKFLDIEISEYDLDCVFSDSVGNFKRDKSPVDLMTLYTPEMQDKINRYREEIYALLEEKVSK